MGCRKAMYVVKDLTECWEECPKPNDLGVTSAPSYDLERQQLDVNFLHSLGICFPGDGDES